MKLSEITAVGTRGFNGEWRRTSALIWLAFAISLILHLAILLSDWRAGGRQSAQGAAPVLQAQLTGVDSVPPEKQMDTPMLESIAPRSPEEHKVPQRRFERDKLLQTVDTAGASLTGTAPLPNQAPQREASEGGSTAEGSMIGVGQGPASQVIMEFELHVGPERRYVGRGRSTYAAADALFAVSIEGIGEHGRNEVQSWRLDVAGRIRDNGLSPETYAGEGELPARLVGHGPAAQGGPFAGRTPDGLLDKQTLFFQFMHLARNNLMNIVIAAAGTYQIFDGVRQEDELIPLDSLGLLKTQKLLYRSRSSGETIEVWLLAEQRQLPLRIRYSGADGVVFDQKVTYLRVTP